MSEHVQIVKVSESIVEYFSQEIDLQNEPNNKQRDIKIQEFKSKLQESLNVGVGKKEIDWIK